MADKSNGQDWEAMEFAPLMQRRTEIFNSIQDQIDALLALDAALKRRARDMGLDVGVDYSTLESSLSRLTGARAGGGSGRRTARRRGAKTRPERFQLMWKDSNEPVLDAQGNPVVFKSKVRMLRGPRYESLLGREKVGKVHLVDTFEDNVVVTPTLTLGPAPGARRR